MALTYSKIHIQQCEVDLKNKPQTMLNASPKGTVPVLILDDSSILDESIDIIIWALNQSDPDGWLCTELQDKCHDLIYYNDTQFKPILDSYKYSQHINKTKHIEYRNKASSYLEQLNSQLMNRHYLVAEQISFADIAIFPFIRQCYMVDKLWFEQQGYHSLQRWLDSFLNSELFFKVMKKTSCSSALKQIPDH
jgi:glutathione S-transferase